MLVAKVLVCFISLLLLCGSRLLDVLCLWLVVILFNGALMECGLLMIAFWCVHWLLISDSALNV